MTKSRPRCVSSCARWSDTPATWHPIEQASRRGYALIVRMRLDAVMVRRGLVSSRSEAAALIGERVVTVSGSMVDRPSRLVAPDEPVEVLRRGRFVSRGGEKLDAALRNFNVSVKGRSVMDIGSSTGGFTDCVLQSGARRVFAIDVGKHQMHERLRFDERVHLSEGTNIRTFDPRDRPFACSLVVADLSFISLTKVSTVLLQCAEPEPGHPAPEFLLLVKPQFEVGRHEASRGRGVISDPELHRHAVESVAIAVEECGGRVLGTMRSPITGAAGNVEFLLHAKRDSLS